MMPLSFLKSITSQTAGGLQFWTDHFYRDGYRIQQHALTQRWRLLDHKNRRIAAGQREECQSRLDQLVPIDTWNQIDEPFVVLLHGLMRTSNCMSTLQHWLLNSGFKRVLRFAYASSRATVLEHGAALAEYVESLPRHSQLSFVGHSMGNIVVRAAIGKWTQESDRYDALSRMHRVVMLGPPNHGAAIARRLSRTGIFGLVAGPGAMQLGPRWPEIENQLGVPLCPFAILAGDRSAGDIQNPLVDGANDYFVSVIEAQLQGATKFATMPLPHTTIMTDRRALEFVTEFLLS